MKEIDRSQLNYVNGSFKIFIIGAARSEFRCATRHSARGGGGAKKMGIIINH